LEREWILGGFLILDTTDTGNGYGAAMSSAPWEGLRNGDEDVASPFRVKDRRLGVQGGQDDRMAGW
jgi:hypothetical protein